MLTKNVKKEGTEMDCFVLISPFEQRSGEKKVAVSGKMCIFAACNQNNKSM